MAERSQAAEVRAALARAREAGARLPPAAERIAVLGRLLESFRDPGSPAHRRLVAELPEATGFSPEVVREGLRLGLGPWSAGALADLAQAELGPGLGETGPRRVSPFESVAVVLGGAIPMPTLLQLLAPLVVGSAVVAKPASADPVTAKVVAETLAGLSPELGAAVSVVDFASDDGDAAAALCEAPCLVASGSDATMAALRARLSPGTRFVAYGHRMSVAVLDGRADGARQEQALSGLATDLCLWDQLGCLSPAFALVHGAERISEPLLEALGRAVAERSRALPRGRVPAAAAAAVAHERELAELRAGARPGVGLRTGDAFVLVGEADAELRPAPGYRLLRLLPVADASALAEALGRVAPHLAAIGVPGGPDRLPAGVLDALCGQLGASRICPLGRMQAPPLAWSHDGQPVLLPLTRLLDLEPARD